MALAQKNSIINAAYEELKSISANKEQRMIYDARLKLQRDIWSIEDGAKREGMQIGLQKGMKKGMKKARKELLAYLKSGHSLEEAEKKFSIK